MSAAPRRVVVKFGSRLLTAGGAGLDAARLAGFAAEIARARARSEVVVVSSGAIACGWPKLGLKARPRALPQLQAAAAAGQSLLMRAWEDALGAHGLLAAQVLLTHADAASRRRFLNARDAMLALLSLGAIPIVNENDTVLIDADLLVLLTDIEGLFDADPRVSAKARLLAEITDIDAQAIPAAGGAGSSAGTGGMITKVQAARKATSSGIPVVIADGREPANLRRALAGEKVGTRFAAAERLAARKHWIAWTLKPEGALTVDPGAARALREGRKSLLPSGVRAVDGTFRRGAAVRILGDDGAELGRGLVAYDADDARKIAGRKSAEIETLLGFTFGDELVHKDDLVLAD